ncbi:hypothetical protein [Rufibacter aurantiacus]|uniref:hypothetical protein n=1 Tax=Rufibacter aurantiacus TaxID=2817374 RepID=UPI001B30B8AE|nr:hypothetical protein [Rufibacter aurantiacus]
MIFEFSMGGYYATNYWVRYKCGVLLCHTSDYPMPPIPEEMLIVQLKDESWNLFLAFLSECTWEKEYLTDVCDGIQWELRVKRTGVNLKLYGSNAFPDDFSVFIGLLNTVIAEAGFSISLP